MSLVALLCHPAAPSRYVTSIAVSLDRSAPDALRIEYVVAGQIDSLRVPATTAASRTDELWRHTCFEVFVRTSAPSYDEFNFAPSGEWAAYRFENYRSGMRPAEIETPAITTQRGASQLNVEVSVKLPSSVKESELRLALSAVIEDHDGTISYWALQHPPGRPDFHHADGFALTVGASL